MESAFDRIVLDANNWPEPYKGLLTSFASLVNSGTVQNYVIIGEKPGDQLYHIDALAIVGLDSEGQVLEGHLFYKGDDLPARFLEATSTLPSFCAVSNEEVMGHTSVIAARLNIQDVVLIGVVTLNTVQSGDAQFATLWIPLGCDHSEGRKVIRAGIERRIKRPT